MAILRVVIETTNPLALAQLTAHLEAHPLDTDASGTLHPLTIEITDETDRIVWMSTWEPDTDD